jgi:hypothetical protein
VKVTCTGVVAVVVSTVLAELLVTEVESEDV